LIEFAPPRQLNRKMASTMSWFKRSERRQPESRKETNVNFVAEQDGAPERRLKSSLVNLFSSDPNVRRAYLVKVDYGNPSAYEVALCLRSETADESLVKRIGNVFANQFGSNQHLDILFLADGQERDLTQVCKPFYSAI